MRTFKVNDKTYKAVTFDFNTVCNLEDMGVTISDMRKKPTSIIRAYFALCADIDADDAGKEIEQHIIKYKSMPSIVEAMTAEMEESDFFRALFETEEEENPTVETETSKKKTSK